MINAETFLQNSEPKNILTIYKYDYITSPAHLKYVKKHQCCITQDGEHCNGLGSGTDAHHLMQVGGHGMGQKESDEWVVPLCRGYHHPQVTRTGDEKKFWEKYGLSYDEAKQIAIGFALNSPDKNIIQAMVNNLKEEGYSDEEIKYMARPIWLEQ